MSRYLAALPASPPTWERPIDELRRSSNALRVAEQGEPEAVAAVQDVVAGGVPGRLYEPRAGVRDVLVFCHGGGWAYGSLDTHEGLARALANRAGCAVLSVDYRLAPEHPYPAAVEDCWAATKWAFETFERVAVAGESAGGNLAAVTALKARDHGLPLAFQVLIYPITDYAVDSASCAEYERAYSLFAGEVGYGRRFRETVRWLFSLYAPDPNDRLNWEVAPLRARSLVGVAPALLITAEHDMLRQEADQYARRMQAAGVPVEVKRYPGQIHGFAQMLQIMDDAHDAVETSARTARRGFAAAPRQQKPRAGHRGAAC